MKKKKAGKSKPKDDRLFALDVSLISGPMKEEFVKKNKEVCRTIAIRGDQTLEDLHYAIFDAFGREDEHLYEFQFGKQPHDRNARTYVHECALEGPFGEETEHEGLVNETSIGSLDLKPRQEFFYWFDFGDDWWHKIAVVSIEEVAPAGKYPRVTKSVGDSPPQYIGWDEEDGR